MQKKLLQTCAVACLLVLAGCSQSKKHPIAMRPALDSMVMWYERMQLDSMKVKNDRLETFLRQHADNQDDSIRMARYRWQASKGVFFELQGHLDSAQCFFKDALKGMEGLENVDADVKLQRIFVMANLADSYRQAGQLDQSANTYLQALHFADSTEFADTTKIMLMLGVSTVYTFMGDYQNSRQWWQRTGEMVPLMSTADQFIYYNNVGNDYYFQQQYPQARDCFQKAIRLIKGQDDRLWDYYTALGNLGEIYICLGQADAARPLLEQSEAYFRKLNVTLLLYYLETYRIELAILEGRLQEARRLVENSEFGDIPIPAAKVLRLKAQEQLMRQLGDFRGAYEAHKAYHALNDSIQDLNIRMQMNTKLMQYEHDKRLSEQQREIEEERMTARQAWALLVVALLAVALLASLNIIWRRRQQMKNIMVRQQIVQMRMENTRNRITPHFTYNALHHEMLAQMEGRKVDLDALTQLLRRGADQASNLETTFASELAFVDYYISIEGRQMAGDFNYEKQIAHDVDPERVKLPAMTIQIFVENAIKHGLQRKGGTLIIRAQHQESATLIEVLDDGKGLSAGYQEHTGIRVVRQTVQMLNEQNKQQITFGMNNQHPGCRSWILLPDNYDYNISTI